MIYLIITTCIHNKFGIRHAGLREATYREAIKMTLKYLPSDIKPIIVENNGKRKTYLDEFGIPILYTEHNKNHYWHKGCNELEDIKAVIQAFNIQDEDMVIKITGRYNPISDAFFRLVKKDESKYDGFVKFFNVCTKEFMANDCVLGLFALRAKYLKKYEMTDTVRSPEIQFATFCRTLNVKEVQQLDVHCFFADNLEMMTC